MATQIKAQDLVKDQVIVDPAGNDAIVIRADIIDGTRVRLLTDMGVAVVDRDLEFPVI